MVVSPAGEKVFDNFYGITDGNNAGEWITYDNETGDVMIYTDSDATDNDGHGFGFLKLTPA